jgi:signal transduction histidine kinase/FixJ family two-component response regulator/putative methionine-R-sulfoxide reductase with GAF domain
MATEKAHQILLIAGDYDVIHQVQQALPGRRFAVQSAFNHREALYALNHGEFDVIVVDAAMSDRHSGSNTLDVLMDEHMKSPVVALASNGDLTLQTKHSNGDGNKPIIAKLEQKTILNAVIGVINPVGVGETLSIKPRAASDDILSQRVEEIQTLFVLSKSLTEVLDLNEVLNRLVEAARRLTDAEEGMILLPGDNDELYLRAKVGIDVENPSNFRIKTKDTLAGEVFKSAKPTLVGASGPQKVKTEYFVNSLLYVPILLKGEPIGVLGVNNKAKEDLFDEHQQQLLLNLASFAAIAIENARIHQEILDHARELQTLVAASQVMNASLSMEAALPNICRQLANVLNVGFAEIYRWDREANQLYSQARFYRSIWPQLGHGPNLDLVRQPILRSAVDNDRYRWLNLQDPVTSNEKVYLEQVGAGAMLVVPVRGDNQMLGLVRMFFIDAPPEPPEAKEIQRLRNISNDIIVNILNQPEQTIRTTGDIFRLALRLNELAGAEWADFSLLIKNGMALSVQARIGGGVWLRRPFSIVELSKHAELAQALETQTLVYQLPDEKMPPAGRVLAERTGSRTVLGIPLVQRGKVQGIVVFADSERQRTFNSREIDLARAIVGQAATALENVNLVRDLEQSLQELKDTQERLVQTARLSAMGELAAVVAHQINNPLTTIIVDTELMLLDEPEDTKNFQALTAIHRAGKRAANVARRLLAIARPTDPNATPELIDVVDTVKGILSLMQTHIERGSIRIQANLPDESLPPVVAVKGQLDDIWLNLLMNAHDAIIGQEDARIGIEVYHVPERKSINVVVWDNGPGIPEDIRMQIFSPFFTTKPVGEGTGLGLHICREVVENVGGTIEVESVPGHHTSFIVRLPVTKTRQRG